MAKTWIRRSLRASKNQLCAYCDSPLPARAKSSQLIPTHVGGDNTAGVVMACNECLGSKSQSDLLGWLAMPFHRVLPKNTPALLTKRLEAAELAQNHELPVSYSQNRKAVMRALHERWQHPRVRIRVEDDTLVFEREQHGRGAALAVLRAHVAAHIEERPNTFRVRVPRQHQERAIALLIDMNCWIIGRPASASLGDLKRPKRSIPNRGLSRRQKSELIDLRDTGQLTTLGRVDAELLLLRDAHRRLTASSA